MATAAELKAQADALARKADEAGKESDRLRTEARRIEREERQAKQAAEAKEHYDRMYDEIGQPLAGLNETQHGIVYAQAYEQGHASGYGEVESYYGEFAEMARKLIEAQ